MDETTAALLGSLDGQRQHVLGILDGLGDSALTAPQLPSGWACLGLVRHLALDVERFWFQTVVAGQPPDAFAESTASAWEVPTGTSAAEVFSLYRREIEQANQIIAAVPLDAAPAHWPSKFGSFWLPNLRAVLLHVITETACHAGHLDAARERIDGRQWMVL